MITLEDRYRRDRLMFRFPEVHDAAVCSVHFQRTLRIPDDCKTYPLPPRLSAFPLRHVDDLAERLPDSWVKRGGVIMPMHQAEAMWLCFDCMPEDPPYPFALKIATGKINAVTGEAWTPQLNDDPQHYIVIPGQPWLDGYCVENGTIGQFVAMPLGESFTAEEQITGAAEHGGIQIIACPMKRERYEALRRTVVSELAGAYLCEDTCFKRAPLDMGLAFGGRMKQEIHDDPYGLDAGDQRHASRCFVSIASAPQWAAITGERPPTTPPSAADYTKAGLPWFDYYGADQKAVSCSAILRNLSSVVEKLKQKGAYAPGTNVSVQPKRVLPLGDRRPSITVRESAFRSDICF